MELENTVYSASEDDGQILICAVMNSSLSIWSDFEVILSLNSTDESSLEGLHHYYNNTEKFLVVLFFSTDFPVSLIHLHFNAQNSYTHRTVACADVAITNDNIAEENKVFDLFLLRTPDLNQRITILNSPPRMLSLQDDDDDDDGIVRLFKMLLILFLLFEVVVFIGFSSSTYIVTESEQQVTMCVQVQQVLNSKSGGALRPFSVSILPEEGI